MASEARLLCLQAPTFVAYEPFLFRMGLCKHRSQHFLFETLWCLAHQNRTIAIASDFRVDGAKSPTIPQKEGVLGSDIAARNRKPPFYRTLKSKCSIVSSLGNRCDFRENRDGHCNRKSQKSLRFWCAKLWCPMQAKVARGQTDTKTCVFVCVCVCTCWGGSKSPPPRGRVKQVQCGKLAF